MSRTRMHIMNGATSSRIVWWNVVAFIIVKVALSSIGGQLALLLDQTILFDSRSVIADTNVLRESQGLPTLTPNIQLDLAAYDKLRDMAQQEYFAHVSPTGVEPWAWITQDGYAYHQAGENLAIGFVTAEAVVDAWARSPSHRANLLHAGYTDIGIAVAMVRIKDLEGMLVVQMFGSPHTAAVAGAVAPPLTAPRDPVVQRISTDTTLVPTAHAETIQTERTSPATQRSTRSLNILYMVVAGALALFSLISLFGAPPDDHHVVFHTALNVLLFLLAVTVPVLHINGTALIF